MTFSHTNIQTDKLTHTKANQTNPSKHTNKRIKSRSGRQAGRQARKQARKQGSKQGSKQSSNQASTHTQTYKQAKQPHTRNKLRQRLKHPFCQIYPSAQGFVDAPRKSMGLEASLAPRKSQEGNREKGSPQKVRYPAKNQPPFFRIKGISQ